MILRNYSILEENLGPCFYNFFDKWVFYFLGYYVFFVKVPLKYGLASTFSEFFPFATVFSILVFFNSGSLKSFVKRCNINHFESTF